MAPALKRARQDEGGAASRGAAAPPELLSLLLELRAELAAMRDAIGAQLERLEQRVARMERARAHPAHVTSALAYERAEGGDARGVRRIVSAPARQLRLDDLSTDLLMLVASALPEDDELAAASCKLRAAVAQWRLSDGRAGARTGVVSALSSTARLAWSVSCGLPLTRLLCEDTARRGQLLQLNWLRARSCLWDEVTCSAAAD
jgi:hypothetical protein